MAFDSKAAERSAESFRERFLPVFKSAQMRADIDRLIAKHMDPAYLGAPYTVIFRDGMCPPPNVLDRMTWDSRFGLALITGSCVVAVISFISRTSGVLIRQIQGAKYSANALCRIAWQKALVETLLIATTRAGYEEALILRAEDGKFYPLDNLPGDEKTRNALVRHYNGTAEALGFVYDPVRRLYILPLRAGT